MNFIERNDPQVWAAIDAEIHRQEDGLEMIASENYTSPAVMQAAGSVLTNKYAEGYPGRRYYGGCENVDVVESLAIDRAKQLFGAEHANVQPHSGSQANMAIYLTAINPGDTAEGLAARVLKEEHIAYPAAIRHIAEGKIIIKGGRVTHTDASVNTSKRAARPAAISPRANSSAIPVRV